MHQSFENFRRHLQTKYFSQNPAITDSLTPLLISPFILKLPERVFIEAQNIVGDLLKLSRSPLYRAKIKSELPFELDGVQQTPSLMSSLDIHLDHEQQLKIIEINTNASAFLINAENYFQRGVKTFPHAFEDLKKSFVETYGDKLKPGNLFLVIDEKPTQQNLYIEFLMFQNFVKKEFSMDCEVVDPSELTLSPQNGLLWKDRPVAAIYNRYTDFYFSANSALATAYHANETLISPNPLTYGLLADKKRFFMLTPALFAQLEKEEGLALPHLARAVLEAKKFGDFASADELWAKRAQYFFKPPNSYGGKSVYRGKSISRTVFQRIYEPGYIAQQIVPAPEVTLPHDGTEHTFKYDLRFYFFEGRIQLASARFYQGQLTNLKTLFGGLTPIEFTK